MCGGAVVGLLSIEVCNSASCRWWARAVDVPPSEPPSFAAEIDAARNRHFVGFVGHGEARHAFRASMLPVLEALSEARADQQTGASALSAAQKEILDLRDILEVPSGESLKEYARAAMSDRTRIPELEAINRELSVRIKRLSGMMTEGLSIAATGKAKP